MRDFDFDDTSIVSPSPQQVSATTPGEAVILDPASSTYYGLDGVGERVWELIQEPRAVGEVRAILQSEFDVEPDVLAKDLRVLLNELVAAGLIEVVSPSG